MLTPLQSLALFGILVFFLSIEYLRDKPRDFNASKTEAGFDFLCFALLAGVTQPVVFNAVGWLGTQYAPQYHNALAGWPWYLMLLLFLVGDDMMQYWWHRASHSPLLWPLHRAHHSVHYMSARMIYRNNFFYYLLMPSMWISAGLFYLGGGSVYFPYMFVKLMVISGAHSAWRWDEPLFKVPALKPLAWLLQRTISTPSTHYAHHAITNADGIGWYKGNYGNLLFFWDVLFGTAHITQKYPAKVGLEDDVLFGKEGWWIEFFYPLIWSKRQHSALVPGGKPYESESDKG